MYSCSLFIRSEDDYSEEEEDEDEDDEEEDAYDGEIPQPELEPRSRRCLVGDAGVCVIPGGNSSEEEDENEEDEDEEGEHDMHGEDSDSDGPVLYKEEDSDEDEEDEPPPSKINNVICVETFELFLCSFTLEHISAWLESRCPGQQGQEEGHVGSEAELPSLCSREGQVCSGQEQQRRPASRTDRPHLAEQGAVGGNPHTDRHCTDKVKTGNIIPLYILLISFVSLK